MNEYGRIHKDGSRSGGQPPSPRSRTQPMLTDEIDRIVAGLSEAQRGVICTLSSDWSWYNQRGSAGWSLAGKGLAMRRFEDHPKGWRQAQYRLTPLGLAVRNRLQENSRGN